ncbi:RNase A-like domain-containing protein [Erwinia sp. AnSW2-5]|uniref:RNase A-like domain-containing protein n=1 Tax=Erwinia sp. AnSW2-5 TaxID=3367692 RepID=UPI00385B9051
MENGFSIALTPVQLAAVMADESVLTERIWGSIGFLGSVLELASATALCLVPEPTGVTKAGCIIVGAHSLDGISASAYQVYSGKPTASMTARATAGIAKELGADKSTADQIGIAVDVILPFSVAGAARVASVRMGQVNLMKHEAVKGIKGGGHTIKKHVGKSELEMRDKIKRGLQSGSLNPLTGATSSFYNLNTAEKALSKAIKVNRGRIRAWAKSTSADRAGAYLELRYAHSSPVGGVITVQSGKLVETNKIEFVLLKKEHNKKPYYILTAFPILD